MSNFSPTSSSATPKFSPCSTALAEADASVSASLIPNIGDGEDEIDGANAKETTINGVETSAPDAYTKGKKPKPTKPVFGTMIVPTPYKNTLPDIVMDPKSLICKLNPSRFTEYHPTSLEQGFKYDIYDECVGGHVDIVDPATYKGMREEELAKYPLDPKDELLIEPEVYNPTNLKAQRGQVAEKLRKSAHSKPVTWLKKDEFISSTHYQVKKEPFKLETRVGFKAKGKYDAGELLVDRQSQIDAIEKTFKDAKKPILKHPTKSGVYAVDVSPIFPDFNNWKYTFSEVVFPTGNMGADEEVMNASLIRGISDHNGKSFVGYFTPTEEALETLREDKDNGRNYKEGYTYKYDYTRGYDWGIPLSRKKKNDTSDSASCDSMFFVERDDGVYYNEVETKITLRKRPEDAKLRQKVAVYCRGIPETAQEYRLYAQREKLLEPKCEDEAEWSDSESTTVGATTFVDSPEQTVADEDFGTAGIDEVDGPKCVIKTGERRSP